MTPLEGAHAALAAGGIQLQLPFCIRHRNPPCDHRKWACDIDCECPACVEYRREAIRLALESQPK